MATIRYHLGHNEAYFQPILLIEVSEKLFGKALCSKIGPKRTNKELQKEFHEGKTFFEDILKVAPFGFDEEKELGWSEKEAQEKTLKKRKFEKDFTDEDKDVRNMSEFSHVLGVGI
jgi:hypothetical protein